MNRCVAISGVIYLWFKILLVKISPGDRTGSGPRPVERRGSRKPFLKRIKKERCERGLILLKALRSFPLCGNQDVDDYRFMINFPHGLRPVEAPDCRHFVVALTTCAQWIRKKKGGVNTPMCPR